MTINELIIRLQALVEQGYGELSVGKYEPSEFDKHGSWAEISTVKLIAGKSKESIGKSNYWFNSEDGQESLFVGLDCE